MQRERKESKMVIESLEAQLLSNKEACDDEDGDEEDTEDADESAHQEDLGQVKQSELWAFSSGSSCCLFGLLLCIPCFTPVSPPSPCSVANR